MPGISPLPSLLPPPQSGPPSYPCPHPRLQVGKVSGELAGGMGLLGTGETKLTQVKDGPSYSVARGRNSAAAQDNANSSGWAGMGPGPGSRSARDSLWGWRSPSFTFLAPVPPPLSCGAAAKALRGQGAQVAAMDRTHCPGVGQRELDWSRACGTPETLTQAPGL